MIRFPNKDFILRLFATGLKFLTLLIILKVDKFTVPIFYFYSTFAAFLHKFTVLSELNNYRRLTNEINFFKINIFYFFNSLSRMLFFLIIIYIFTSFFEYKSYFISIALFILTTFLMNYISTIFVVNSNQLSASIVYFIGSASLFFAVIIASLIEGNFLNNICIIYFFLSCLIFVVKFGIPKIMFSYDKKFINRFTIYFIRKNFNIRLFYQLRRGFNSVSGYLITALVAYYISSYEHLNIDLKNLLIISLYISNIILLYLLTSKVFPHVLKITKGEFKLMGLKKIIQIISLLIIMYFITIFSLPQYFEIVTIFYSISLFVFFSYLISFQDFYIQARTIKLKYFACFILFILTNFYLLDFFYGQFFFLPILLILPRFSIFLLNKLFFKEF